MARQKDLLVEAGRKVGIVWLPPHILICCLLSVCGTVRGCYSGGTAGSIPGRDERGCDISVRILMVILGDLSRGNSKYTTRALDSSGFT